jgi:ferritin-like metal-binding protein YciE
VSRYQKLRLRPPQKENDMAVNNLRDALVDEIKDLYSAEKQLTKALPKLAKAASNDQLREAFESHLEETEGHVSRLEQVFELLDEKPRAKHCAGIAGIIEEGGDTLQQDAEDSVMDACLIAAGQRAEHYEMAAYGTVIAWSEALGLNDVANVLKQTLAEEKAADEKLSALADSGINQAATAGESDEMDEDEEDESVSRAPQSSAPMERSASARSASSASTGNGRSTRQRGGRR